MKAMTIQTRPRGIVHEANRATSAPRVRTKRLRRLILWGGVSLAAYLLVFLNQETVTQYFTQGGFVAAAVVITALGFSVIHGTFASYVLEVIGIEALRRGKEGH